MSLRHASMCYECQSEMDASAEQAIFPGDQPASKSRRHICEVGWTFSKYMIWETLC